jgi:hypothetical protein
MEVEKIIKVKFLKSGDYISTTGEEIIEINVDFDQLLGIISEIELKRDGLGKSLHKEAFTGLDYLGNKVTFSSYVVWQDGGKIYKYNFDEDWIPFNRVKRDETIKKLLDD